MGAVTQTYAVVLERIGRDVLAALDGLSDEQLNHPAPVPEANTLFALATHLAGAGEYWTLTLVGARDIPRDREAEFHTSGRHADLVGRYERWLAEVGAMLAALPDAELAREVPKPAGRPWLGDGPLTVSDCLLHAVEHSALHLGHIQLTRQLLLSGTAG
jgi:uncharacterized damage-inducible protein DinB